MASSPQGWKGWLAPASGQPSTSEALAAGEAIARAARAAVTVTERRMLLSFVRLRASGSSSDQATPE